jgi:flagellar biosynthesis protein FlhA
MAIAEGYLTVDASTVIATHLNQLMGERPQLLLGPDEVKVLLEALKPRAGSLVETVYPNPLTLAAMTRLLRNLLEDGIPIAHPMPILSSIAQAVQVTQDHDRIIDLVRADLGALIVSRLCGPNDRLPVVTLDAGLEAMIVQGMVDPVTGQPLIEPDLARTVGERVAQLLAERGRRAARCHDRPAAPAPRSGRAAASARARMRGDVDCRTARNPAGGGDLCGGRGGCHAPAAAIACPGSGPFESMAA